MEAAGVEAGVWRGRVEGQEHSLSACGVMSSGSLWDLQENLIVRCGLLRSSFFFGECKR